MPAPKGHLPGILCHQMLSNASACSVSQGSWPVSCRQPLVLQRASEDAFYPKTAWIASTPRLGYPSGTAWSLARDPLSSCRGCGPQACDDKDRPCLPATPGKGRLECLARGEPVDPPGSPRSEPDRRDPLVVHSLILMGNWRQKMTLDGWRAEL